GLLLPAFHGGPAMGYLPQTLGSVVVASLLGAGPGILALAAAAGATALLPLAGELLETARLPAAAALLGVLAAGTVRDAAEARERRLMERIRDSVKRGERFSRMSDTLIRLNEELEARVSGQRESVSTLYARIRKLDSLELKTVLGALLEGVSAFSQAEKAAVYEYDAAAGTLVLQAWIGAKPEPSLELAGRVEGWVFRNDRPFSLRMVGSELGFDRLDSRRSVLAYPLKSGAQAWGVLNIEEMPFYRYNPTTEKNLEIIVSLSAAYIGRAVDFRERVLKRPRNEVTGLPGYGELVRLLGEELARRDGGHASVSVVLVEFLDFEALVFAHSGVKALGLVKATAVESAKAGRAIAFHYKEGSQLAFILPGKDRDGASLFCLEFAQLVGRMALEIDGEPVRLEPVFGLAAALRDSGAEALLAEAERLLCLSRASFAERVGPGSGSGP
ncbi:MAG TPA: GAF domain-containing protein, partial [Rectinemataceae bacterium]|nr:GAF domain-containing protein [Rectinemataceae bacterium]